jgi:hypothetical protein
MEVDMSSRLVSFRFLHAVTNAITHDQVTVGLLQSDGAELRFAGDSRRIAGDLGRATVRRALGVIRSQLPRPTEQTSYVADIHEVFPIVEGEGSMLRWGDVQRTEAADPERHFRNLALLAELSDELGMPYVGRREISTALAALGEDLRAQYGERVRTNTNVRGHFEYNVPLSWEDDGWCHTVAVNADVHSASELRDSICEVIGLLGAAIPRRDGAVLVYLPPLDSDHAASVERELEYVRQHGGERVRLAPLRLSDDGLDVSAVERMAIEDFKRVPSELHSSVLLNQPNWAERPRRH